MLSSPSAPSLSVLLVACLLPVEIVAFSRVELVNNGYENLVIGISPSLPESEGATLIPVIKVRGRKRDGRTKSGGGWEVWRER